MGDEGRGGRGKRRRGLRGAGQVGKTHGWGGFVTYHSAPDPGRRTPRVVRGFSPTLTRPVACREYDLISPR